MAAGFAATRVILAVDAQLVTVDFSGLPDDAYRYLTVSRISPFGAERDISCFLLPDGSTAWQVDRSWVRAIQLRLPADYLSRLRAVRIQIGEAEYIFGREELLSRWSRLASHHPALAPGLAELVTLQSPPVAASGLPGLVPRGLALNWPAVSGITTLVNLLRAALERSLLLGGILMLLAIVYGLLGRSGVGRRWLSILLGDGDVAAAEDSPSNWVGWSWFAAGLLVLIFVLVRLHLSDRYWFTQDDHRVQFLPNIVYGCRAIFGGQFPTWSPHEMLGAPLMEPGHYPLTYPPTLLSFWIARALLSEESMTLQVWCWMHLLAGYVAAFVFGRTVGLRPVLAAGASLSFVLSGFFLVLGRAWTGVTPLTVWIPLVLLPVALHLRGAGPRLLTVLSGLFIGGAFHSANTQFWVYSLLFVGAALVLLHAGRRASRAWRWALPGLLLGLAIASPVMVPQLQWASRLLRSGGEHWGLLPNAASVLLPPEVVDRLFPNRPGRSDLSGFYYCGTVMAGTGVLASALLLGALLLVPGASRLVGRNSWLLLGLLSLNFAAGDAGFLWCPLAQLPGLQMLNHPIKMLPFLGFFLTIGGAMTLERVLAAAGARGWMAGAIFVLAAGAMVHNAKPGLPCFTEWPIPLPYPDLKGLVSDDTRPGLLTPDQRFMPVAQSWNGSADNLWSLSFSLPVHYALLSVDGYGPLVQASPENHWVSRRFVTDPIASARAYGVRWLLQRDRYRPPEMLRDLTVAADMSSSKLDSPDLLADLRRGARVVRRLEDVTVWELQEPAPMAFLHGNPASALPVAFRPGGADVDTTSLSSASRIVVNVLARPRLFALAGAEHLKVEADDWGRLVVTVPAGTRLVEVRYRPDWLLGLFVGLVFAVSSGLLLRRSASTMGEEQGA